jgi:ribosomal protein S18 acetylase RimI-like enzyme
MDLRQPSPNLIDAALSLYNESTERVPVGFPAQPVEFQEWIELRRPRLEYQRTVLLMDSSRCRGIARWGVGGPEAKPEDWYTVESGDGAIAALFVSPGDLEAASFAVEEATRDLADRGCRRVWAWEDEMAPPFYAGGFGQLSLTMSEVVHALAAAHFRPGPLELHLRLEGIEWAVSSAGRAGLQVGTSKLPTGETAIDAWSDDGQPLGQCVWAAMSHRSAHPDARRAGYVWWLGIEEQHRGRGLGRRLLEIALGQMARNGHSQCVLTTRSDNLRAQALYYSMGFQALDASATFCLEPQKNNLPLLGNPAVL